MRQRQPPVQRLVPAGDRAHQHVGAARGVLGQRMHRQVHRQALAQVEGIEGQARAPGVVQRDERLRRALAHPPHQTAQVRELQRDRARRLQPDQPGGGRQRRLQRGHVHRVVDPVRDAPGLELVRGKAAARAVDVVGQQQLVAAGQQRDVDQRDRRQAAGRQQDMVRALQRGQPRLQRQRGGRAVQAVGVAAAVDPLGAAQRLDRREEHRRGLVHRGQLGIEARRRGVRMVDLRGLRPHRPAGIAAGIAHSSSPIRSWPSTPLMRTRANSPTFIVREALDGGRIFTVPSISGASA